jgi:predicted transcriptional regulator
MRRTPCEYMLWIGIPTIRRELAETLIKQYGLSQREAAEKLGITPSAVCQYLSKKRGKIDISDKSVIEQVAISAERIVKNGDAVIVIETCRICHLIRKTKEFTTTCEETQDEKK